MKILKVILLTFLVLKTSVGLGAITLDLNSSCCPDKQEILEDSSDTEDNKGCCDNSVCDCLCCGHIFTFSKLIKVKPNKGTPINSTNSAFINFYTFENASGIWQPPRQG